MLRYFDTHSHQVYHLNHANHLQLLVSTSYDDALRLTKIAQLPNVLLAVGTHPWFADSLEIQIDCLRKISDLTDVAAIGEIGLDFYPEYLPTQDLQIKIFEQQLLIAKELHLPVSIHARKALPTIYRILKRIGGYGCMHGFMGSVEQAQQFIALGFKIGVNGVVCNVRATRYHSLVKHLSLADVVLETDYPYVTNKDGMPVLIDEVAECVAKLKDLNHEEVATVTYNNACSIFNRKFE